MKLRPSQLSLRVPPVNSQHVAFKATNLVCKRDARKMAPTLQTTIR